MVFAQGLDKGPDFHDLLGVQPHRGLIQDHHLRVPQQGLGNAHPLLVSLGEVPDEPLGYRLDLGNRHDPAHLFLQGAPRQALGLSHKGEVFQRRPVQVEGRPLGQVANAPLGLGRILKDIVSPHRDLPLRGRQAACHNVHGGGFPRAIGAEKAIDLSCFNVKRQIGHSGMGAIPLGEIFHFNQKGSSFSRSLGPETRRLLR